MPASHGTATAHSRHQPTITLEKQKKSIQKDRGNGKEMMQLLQAKKEVIHERLLNRTKEVDDTVPHGVKSL